MGLQPPRLPCTLGSSRPSNLWLGRAAAGPGQAARLSSAGPAWASGRLARLSLTPRPNLVQRDSKPPQSLTPRPNLVQRDFKPPKSLTPRPNLVQIDSKPRKSLTPGPNLVQRHSRATKSLTPRPNLVQRHYRTPRAPIKLLIKWAQYIGPYIY